MKVTMCVSNIARNELVPDTDQVRIEEYKIDDQQVWLTMDLEETTFDAALTTARRLVQDLYPDKSIFFVSMVLPAQWVV